MAYVPGAKMMGERKGFKSGGAVNANAKTPRPPEDKAKYKTGGAVKMMDDADKKPMKRADRKKSGGKCYKSGGAVKMDAGAGGGKGRLEKIKDYGKNK